MCYNHIILTFPHISSSSSSLLLSLLILLLLWLACPLILFLQKINCWLCEEEELMSQTHVFGVLCALSVSTNSEWHMGRLLPHSFPPPPILAGVEGGGGLETVPYLWCSIGLLMWAMLRMMELRGLTNFGKSEQEEESRGGIWGLLLQPVWSWNLKKMAQRCCEI